MARRTARSGIPLEWKTDVVGVSDGTVTGGEFDLDLLPNEIAEIWQVDSTISIGTMDVDDTDIVDVRMYLSMDPDASGDPHTSATIEDLEVFYFHNYRVQLGFTSSGMTLGRMTDTKIAYFSPYPVLIGTNFAQVIAQDVNTDNEVIDVITTVYFKRRRATAAQLNQILLKRR